MEWAANITTANWVGLLQVSLFVFIILLGFPMAFTLLAMSVIFGYFYIVWMVWKGEVATLAANAGGKVQSAVKALGWFVLVGWAIYPIGYIAGTAGGLFGVPMFQNLEMDLVYNIGDAINKIGFGLVIYALATKD